MVTKRTPAKPQREKRRPKTLGELDPTLWDDLAAIVADVPTDEWRKLPKDGARHFDDYIEEMGR